MYDSPVKWELLGPDSFMQLIPIRYNRVLNRDLSDTVQLMIRETGLVDGSAMNRSVNIILKGRPQLQFVWAGPMVAYGERGTSIDPFDSKDIDMADVRHLIDELNVLTRLNSNEHAPHTPHEGPSLWQPDEGIHVISDDDFAFRQSNIDRNGSSIRKEEYNMPYSDKADPYSIVGVRVCCFCDTPIGGARCETTSVPADSIIWTYQSTSDIAQRIGMPIIVYGATDCHVREEDTANNHEVSLLHFDSDLMNNPYGQPSSEWDGTLGWPSWKNKFGCAIIVHKDMEPFPLEHFEALCSWCQYKLFPIYKRDG
jgi:hypothetical protein